MSGLRVQRVVTSGTFSLDGGTWEVENNVWLIGDDDEVLVVDAAHDADAIASTVGDRRVAGIVCTHAHDDHINQAAALSRRTDAPVHLHPADRVLWDMVYEERLPDAWLSDGQVLSVAGTDVHVIHTPGHAPGAVCLYVPALATVFTGDTLFQGGPGATGRSYSDYPTILASIRDRLVPLPPDTVVRTGHGDDTTIGAEAHVAEEWRATIE